MTDPESLRIAFTASLKPLVERRIIKANADTCNDPEWMTDLGNEELRQATTDKNMTYIFAGLKYYKRFQKICGNKDAQGSVNMVWIKDIPDDDALAKETKQYAATLENDPKKNRTGTTKT
ncbi:hypothetical protein GGI26_003186 [Coemansia sp. RSA 1358]|nr:hypothetical protein GGI26_003186 [Coemansia sp. RSA 1358]